MSLDSIEKEKTGTVKRTFVAVAVTEDRLLAKDYKELLISQGFSAEVEKCKDDTDGQPSYAIKVDEEFADQAIDLIQSRNPADYFYDTLFSDNKDLDDFVE